MKAKLLKLRNNTMRKNLIQLNLVLVLLSFALSSCTHEVVTDSETVSKKEYDELQKKYNDLLAEKTTAESPQIEVDLKGEEIMLSTSEEVKPLDPESQYQSLMMSEEYIGKGDYEKAISILKQVENSEIKQIKVRAKYLQGEIFFNQKEYDQAMQKYDEIITTFGFSSVAILAIEKKDACIKNLNLPITQEPYHLIYTDFTKS